MLCSCCFYCSFPLLAWLGTIPNSRLSLHPTIDHIYTIYIFYIYTIYTCVCVALTMDPKQLKSASTVRKMKLNYKNNANNTSKANVKENTTEGGRHTPPPPPFSRHQFLLHPFYFHCCFQRVKSVIFTPSR